MTPPVATYRIQLNKTFDLNRAAETVPYLKTLGISHVYVSPCLKAVSGSTHGYDVTDFTRVNPELGGEAAFDRFCRVLDENGMGQMMDIVPNHMAAHVSENALWRDVLTHGPDSRCAQFFDIRWQSKDDGVQGKIVLPILGDHYDTCLISGDLVLAHRAGEVVLTYFDRNLPLSKKADAIIRQQLENDDPSGLAFLLEKINASPDRLHHILERCHYRLAYWKTAWSDINYRRFFDINELVGLCMDNPAVFEAVHRLVLKWYGQGQVEGFRVDHPDGLKDPETYFTMLTGHAPDAWVVVEKILETGEKLPDTWPVAGTTGYDFLNMVNGLFVDPAGKAPLTALYRDLTGAGTEYDDVVREKKHRILKQSFSGEIRQLVDLLKRIRFRHRPFRDVVEPDLQEALMETIACFPVYRTYVRPEDQNPGKSNNVQDIQWIRHALNHARTSLPRLDDRVWDFLEACLKGDLAGTAESEFAVRFQQLTGPVMAKGVEDTAFYCFNRLLSLNEVGGNSDLFGTTVGAFHRHCRYIRDHYPMTLSATSTHDTKRGEDARMRINLLSEIPDTWTTVVKRWEKMTAPYHSWGLPDDKTRYFFFQTLTGVWPMAEQRLTDYMLKAVKEAKEHTSWTDPDETYERILEDFIHKCLSNGDFIKDVDELVSKLKQPAQISSLSQTLIKCTAPGIPDIYQGCELWCRHLVDPDNRRPVDFEMRQNLLSALSDTALPFSPDDWEAGLPKLYVIRSALAVRRNYAASFGKDSRYRPIAAKGLKSDHAVAFERGESAITLVPRLLMGLNDDWADTTVLLPRKNWLNVFTQEVVAGGETRPASLLSKFPVALLVDADNSA